MTVTSLLLDLVVQHKCLWPGLHGNVMGLSTAHTSTPVRVNASEGRDRVTLDIPAGFTFTAASAITKTAPPIYMKIVSL